jgi:hypothetical protein
MQVSGMLSSRREREIWPGRFEKQGSYFDLRRVGEIVRGLVYVSVLWGLLAVGVYAVYGMVATR